MAVQDELLEQFKKQLIEAGVYDDTKGERPQMFSWQPSVCISGTDIRGMQHRLNPLSGCWDACTHVVALVSELLTLPSQTCTSCGAFCALGSMT